MRQLDCRRTIETGKIANLVRLRADLPVDIHNTRSVRAVVLNGKLYPRDVLDAMLMNARALANRQDTPSGE